MCWSHIKMWINDLLIHVFSQRGTLSSGRVLGGSGSINYMHHIRGSRHDFDAWEKEGATGWSYKDVLPYFIKSEDVQIPELKDSRKKKIVSWNEKLAFLCLFIMLSKLSAFMNQLVQLYCWVCFKYWQTLKWKRKMVNFCLCSSTWIIWHQFVSDSVDHEQFARHANKRKAI